MDIQTWLNSVNGQTIDMDGAYGGQCWDLWSSYARNVYGIPAADTNTVDGYAASVYTARYDRSAEHVQPRGCRLYARLR